jgi:ABC-type sugar transport system ATPase subunit
LRVTPDIDRHSEGTELRAGVEILSTRGLRKTFPGVVALDTVDFDVRAGEVHALLGANGAGKSTLIKLIAGLYSPDAGEITLFDRPANFTSAADAMAAGVSVIYQDFALIPYLNVAENIFLGNEIRGPFGLVDWTATHREARRLLDSGWMWLSHRNNGLGAWNRAAAVGRGRQGLAARSPRVDPR